MYRSVLYNVWAPLDICILHYDLPCRGHMITLLSYDMLCHHAMISRDWLYHIARGLAYSNFRGHLLFFLYILLTLRLAGKLRGALLVRYLCGYVKTYPLNVFSITRASCSQLGWGIEGPGVLHARGGVIYISLLHWSCLYLLTQLCWIRWCR